MKAVFAAVLLMLAAASPALSQQAKVDPQKRLAFGQELSE